MRCEYVIRKNMQKKSIRDSVTVTRMIIFQNLRFFFDVTCPKGLCPPGVAVRVKENLNVMSKTTLELHENRF